jgi:hypothetical protein
MSSHAPHCPGVDAIVWVDTNLQQQQQFDQLTYHNDSEDEHDPHQQQQQQQKHQQQQYTEVDAESDSDTSDETPPASVLKRDYLSRSNSRMGFTEIKKHIPRHFRTLGPRSSKDESRFKFLNCRSTTQANFRSSSTTLAESKDILSDDMLNTDFDILFNDLDNDCEEVKEARQLPPANIFQRRRLYRSYSAIREIYNINRIGERDESHKTLNKFQNNLKRAASWLRRGIDFFTGYHIAVTFMMLDLISDLLFCAQYLSEIHFNVSREEENAPSSLPTWLWTYRPYGMFLVAVIFSAFNVISLIIRTLFADNKFRAFFDWSFALGKQPLLEYS